MSSTTRPDPAGNELDGYRVSVVGGASGIGQATVALARRRGARVVIVDRADPADIHADVAEPEACARAIEASVDRLGGLDGLVITAGVSRYATVEESDAALWQSTLAVNLVATGLLARAAVPHLRAGGRGAIVTVASAAGLRGYPSFTVYASSKAGLVAWTRAAAVELAHRDIRVNCVSPGPIDTPMIRAAIPAGHTVESWGEELGRHTPFGRIGTPAEVAEAICFLLSNRASYITGAILPVDGGEVA